MSVSQQPATGDGDSGDRPDFPLSDAPLLDLLDALVNDLGRVAAAEALGVNYRTMTACYDSRRGFRSGSPVRRFRFHCIMQSG